MNNGRKVQRQSLDSWARLDVDWYDDEVVRAAAEMQPAVLTLWPILVAMGKAESCLQRNPSGTIRRTVKQLADCCMTGVDQVHRALDVMVEGELITYSPGRLGVVEIRLNRFEKWQTIRGSKSERDERSGAPNENTFAGKTPPQLDTDSTPARPVLDNKSAPDIDLDLDVDLDLDEEQPPANAVGLPRTPDPDPATHLPSPTSVEGQIRRCKTQLGNIGMDLELLIERRREQSNGKLTPSRLLAEAYRPAAELMTSHGRDRLAEAFRVASRENATSMKFVSKVCDRLNEQQQPRRPKLVAVSGMTDADLDALDVVEGVTNVVV